MSLGLPRLDPCPVKPGGAGNDSTLVGLSLPRHILFNARLSRVATMRIAISRPSPCFPRAAAAQLFMRVRGGAQARVPSARSSFNARDALMWARAAYALHTPSRCVARADAG